MVRLHRGILVAGVLGLILLILILAAMPGTVVTARYASGEPADRTAIAALVGLLMIGLAAVGFDLRDLF